MRQEEILPILIYYLRPLQCHEFPRSAFRVNVEGMFNILEACCQNNVDRLVFVSIGIWRCCKRPDDRGPSLS